MLKSKMKRYIAMLLFVMMLFNLTTVYADNIKIEEDTTVNLGNSKIDPELQKVMDEATDDELIPVWLWRESIDDKLVDQLMIKEKGMDPAVYEDEAKFNSRRLPQIEKAVEEELGYEKAHAVIAFDEVMTDSNITLTDIVTNVQSGRTPIDEAVSEEFDEFVMAKRSIQKREQSAHNQQFIDKHVKQFGDREIIYNGEYTSTLIVTATKKEIEYYAKQNEISGVSLYIECIDEIEVNIVLEQVGVYGVDGTGVNGNNWSAQSGEGVKIGILEGGNGLYDSHSAQLEGNNRIQKVYNNSPSDEDEPTYTSDHATVVTAIIAGNRVQYGTEVYAGVALGATVYQMPIVYSLDVITGISQLAGMGGDIINYSGGVDTGTGYTEYDKEIDKVVKETGIIFVKSAGNEGLQSGNITSPGKALNVITVGNVETKNSITSRLDSPYSMYGESSFREEFYLPNKPDISAPGTNICIVHDIESENGLLYGNGTSLSAPIVTGIIAQMLSENPTLKGNPLAVKAALILGAQQYCLNVSNDTYIDVGMRDKSGTGFLDARYALERILPSEKFTIDLNETVDSELYYFNEGEKVKAVMAFNKKNEMMITDSQTMDDLQLILVNRDNNRIVYYTSSTRGNVEILEAVIRESGYYRFMVAPQRIVDENNFPDVAVAYRIVR